MDCMHISLISDKRKKAAREFIQAEPKNNLRAERQKAKRQAKYRISHEADVGCDKLPRTTGAINRLNFSEPSAARKCGGSSRKIAPRR